jgi:hypothetical protein
MNSWFKSDYEMFLSFGKLSEEFMNLKVESKFWCVLNIPFNCINYGWSLYNDFGTIGIKNGISGEFWEVFPRWDPFSGFPGVLDRSEDQSHVNTWHDLNHLKAPRLRITLYVSSTVPNHTPHNPEMVMINSRLYKGELASPLRYDSFFTTLSTHSFSVPLLTWASEC